MNEQQLAAVKQALEALEKIYIAPEHLDYIANWWPACRDSIPELRQVIAQHALDKMAENARELGLSYDDNFCDKNCVWTDHHPDCERAAQPPQPVPVKTYHDGKPWPVAPKPWVGLTDEEVMQTMSGDWTSQFYFARAIEAKLKEKNHG